MTAEIILEILLGAGRPTLPEGQKKIAKTVRFSQEQIKKAEESSKKKGLSFSAWCIKKIFGS